jgi:hypothetical protein
MTVNGTTLEMDGLDLRHDMDIVTDQNGTYSTHMFADRAQKLVKQHAQYNNDQVRCLIWEYNNPKHVKSENIHVHLVSHHIYEKAKSLHTVNQKMMIMF